MLVPVVLLVITLVATAAIMLGVRRTGVVPMPSSRSTRATVARIVGEYPDLAQITDLGSGWGGLARHLAQAHPAPRLEAVEHSLVPHLVGQAVSRITHPRRIRHLRRDIASVPLGPGCYVTYLSPGAMAALRARFETELPRGGLLISIAFAMPGWTPARVETAADLYRTEIFVYEY
jgi:hypothetical protein